jgi:hypothetical protein
VKVGAMIAARAPDHYRAGMALEALIAEVRSAIGGAR